MDDYKSMPMRRAHSTVALLALAAAAPTTGPATRPTTPFASEEFRFKLRYPADWIRPERPDVPAVLTLWMPLGARPATRPAADMAGDTRGRLTGLRVGGVGLRISHAEQDGTGKRDADILRDLSGAMAANLFADLDLNAKHVAVRPAKVGELASRQIRFVVQPAGGGPEVTVAYVVAVHKGTEYVFNVAAPTPDFERLWPDVAAMLASFEVGE